MKGNHKSKIRILIIVGVILAFVLGITAGVIAGNLLSGEKTEENKAQVSSQGETDKNTDKAGQENSNHAADADKSGQGQEDNGEAGTDTAKGTEGSKDQVNQQAGGSLNTYDSSIPADDSSIHRYEYIVKDATWEEAFQDCISRGGYLVRINSENEYEAIRKEISKQKLTNIYFHIGGRRDSQSQEYYWANEENKLFGEELNSENVWCSDAWKAGEPSFQDGNLEEKYMSLFFFDGEKRFVWNDTPNDMLAAEPAYSGQIGYICEYEN